jgi:hypothetical protein
MRRKPRRMRCLFEDFEEMKKMWMMRKGAKAPQP